MTLPSSRYDYSFDPSDDSTASRVCRLVGQGRQVLELGCAAGAMSAVMTHHYGCSVTGVEYDPAAAAEAKQHCAQVHVLSLDEPGWEAALVPAVFDTVVAADVLEHLRDPHACLRTLRAILPADGQLVVSVPSLANSGVLAGLLLNRFDYCEVGLLDRTHIHFFTTATLGEALVQAGFEVTDVQTIDASDWHPEFAHLWKGLPEALQAWLKQNPAGQAFQVVMRAVPSEAPAAFVDPFQESQRAWLNQFPALPNVDDSTLSGASEPAAAAPAASKASVAPATPTPWWRRWFAGRQSEAGGRSDADGS
ncbi:MAG: class I SAM-dependent methyltransferase [Burkholderiaceae bacterium]